MAPLSHTVFLWPSLLSSHYRIVASGAALKELLERPLEGKEILVIYIDGIHCGERCVIGAVGVDSKGYKTVLGIQEGATENAAACKDLLQNLVARGLDTRQRRLFVIDGSKALRSAIHAVFGQQHPVQRSRQHKLSNVIERLPKDQQDQMRSAIRAAWKMNAKEGMARLRKLADWLERARLSRRQFAGRPGRVLYHQPSRATASKRRLRWDASSVI